MKLLRIIILLSAILLLNSKFLHSGPLYYKDFILGDGKRNLSAILNKPKYSQCAKYFDSNDRYFYGIKVKPGNSVKIIIKKYPETEEILLVFDNNDVLFDIYIKKNPMDIRDFTDYKVSMLETWGKPAEVQVLNEKAIIVWNLNKKRNSVYLIYEYNYKNLIINMRDLYLNMKYDPLIK